jgi:hypothetical protein
MLQQTLHKISHNSLHTQWMFTIRHALESWDPALTCEASKSTMRATCSQQRVKNVHTFRTPAKPQTSKAKVVRPAHSFVHPYERVVDVSSIFRMAE